MTERIAVLLSTHNGERFLADQLDSILQQSHADLVILARDDGSTDGTLALLQRYRQQHSERMRLVKSQTGNLGACASYGRLIAQALESKSDLGLEQAYLCFADQDDVWHPDKLKLNLQALQEIEQNGSIAALVHSDLEVVDGNLQPVAPSLAAFQGLRPRENRMGRVLVANAVTGCTVMINENLAHLAAPIPTAAVMHDWWLALVAAAAGKTVYLDAPLVKYRQHDSNTLGAKPLNAGGKRFRTWLARAFDDSAREVFDAVALQSQAFSARFGDDLSRREQRLCRMTALLRKGPAPVRKLLYRWLRSQ